MRSDEADRLDALWDSLAAGERPDGGDPDLMRLLDGVMRAGHAGAPREAIWRRVAAARPSATGGTAMVMNGRVASPQATTVLQPVGQRRGGWWPAAQMASLLLAVAALTFVAFGGRERVGGLLGPGPTPTGRSIAVPQIAETPAPSIVPTPTPAPFAEMTPVLTPLLVEPTILATITAVEGQAPPTPEAGDGSAVLVPTLPAVAPTIEPMPTIAPREGASFAAQEPSDSCKGATARMPIAPGPDGEVEVALLRIGLEAGAVLTLPEQPKLICSEAGDSEVRVPAWGEDWFGVTTPLSDLPGAVELRGGEGGGTVLVALVGQGVRRLAIGDGVTVLDLGGRTGYGFGQGLALVRIEHLSLDAGAAIDRDTGRAGAAVIAIDDGVAELRQSAGSSFLMSRDSEGGLVAYRGDGTDAETGTTTLHSGDAAFIDVGAAFTLAVEPQWSAAVTLLTIAPNSALVAPVTGDAGGGTPTATSATSATGTSGSPVPAAVCTTERLSEESVNAIAGTPIPQPTVDAILARERFAPGAGTPAEPEMVAVIEAINGQLVACLNAGETMRSFALFSPAWFAESLGEGMTYAGLDVIAVPNRPLGQPTTWDVRVQADGRITAKVEQDGAASLFTYVAQDGRWLIDAVDEGAIIEPAPMPSGKAETSAAR